MSIQNRHKKQKRRSKIFTFLIPALIGGIAAIIGGGIAAHAANKNTQAQAQANRENIALQKETNQQNVQLTHESWERDDTSMQRKAEDLAAAGLSPHLAAGGSGAGVSAPIKMEAPKNIQAPQTDLSGLVDAVGVLGNLGKVQAETKQTYAQTDLLNQQIEASKKNMQYQDAQIGHTMMQNQLLTQNLLHGSSVLRNMEQDYAYAKQHNLPVGKVEENQIRRFEFVMDKIQNLAPLLQGGASTLQEGIKEKAIEAVTSPNGVADKLLMWNNPFFKSASDYWNYQKPYVERVGDWTKNSFEFLKSKFGFNSRKGK